MESNRLNDIAAFVASVKTGSFTAGANTLGLTRSAVGKSIGRLETQLGVRLLNRTTRQLSLTDDGKIVFERCRQILDDLDEMEAAIATRRSKPTGILKLTAPLSLGTRHILPIVDKYLGQWSELRADIWFTDRFVDLIDEGFDIAVRIGEPHEDSQVMTRTIALQQFITCASPDYLKRNGAPEHPRDLDKHDTIVFISSGRPRPWEFETSSGTYIHDAPGRLNIDSSEAMRQSALDGFGLVNLPTYILGADVQEGALVEVLHAYRPKPDPIRVTYPTKRHLSPRTRGFIDLLIEEWQQGAPWERTT